MISIIIPTLNNLQYLKLCVRSLEINSTFKNQIIFHINNGSDGSLDFIKEKKFQFTHSEENLGMCKAINLAAKLAKNKYIVYAHDDFYFCPKWDEVLINEAQKLSDQDFFLSGTMIKAGQVHRNYGNDFESFNEKKLLEEYSKINYYDFQGSSWCPSLLTLKLWNEVGGLSEEFDPGTASDTDLNMKLWSRGVRIHKGLGKSLVYHFGSIITRKKKNLKTKTYTGSRGTKIFLKKWGITVKFFEKFYLRGCSYKDERLFCKKYDGPLTEPKITMNYLLGLLKCKIFYIYLKLINYK